jgi:signal transduction histidine kinase
VHREFQPVEPLTIDRHKLLQILFNLLENAKYACLANGRSEKQVTVRIRKNGQERTYIEVRDNGIGIPAENLPRIFGQEFSTRQGGHGFGLHSSILAAQDMGAGLSAASGGPGQGALFVLDLPASPPGKAGANGLAAASVAPREVRLEA